MHTTPGSARPWLLPHAQLCRGGGAQPRLTSGHRQSILREAGSSAGGSGELSPKGSGPEGVEHPLPVRPLTRLGVQVPSESQLWSWKNTWSPLGGYMVPFPTPKSACVPLCDTVHTQLVDQAV